MNSSNPVDWEGGAIGNAVWTGAQLVDVLRFVDVTEDPRVEHVQFEGADRGADGLPYGTKFCVDN